MIKYVLLALIVLCFIVTLYQLYLNNSWTSMIMHKQQEYTKTPSITSNTKPLVHRLEACAVCLVCTLVLPTQIASNNFAAKESAMDNSEVNQSVAYDDSMDGLVAENSAAAGAPMSTTSMNKNYLNGSDAVFSVFSSKQDSLMVSLEMLNPSAELLSSEDFLALFEGKDLVLSDQMITSCDYIVRVSSESLDERELLFKIEENQYIICDSANEICYVVNK